MGPAHVGVVADTSALIKMERAKLEDEAMLARMLELAGNETVVISAITYTELTHGLYRSATQDEFEKRERFLSVVTNLFEVIPYTKSIARVAGQIGGEHARLGGTLPFADLMIGATAIELGYAVLTHNLKDYVRIPGLRVIPFAVAATKS